MHKFTFKKERIENLCIHTNQGKQNLMGRMSLFRHYVIVVSVYKLTEPQKLRLPSVNTFFLRTKITCFWEPMCF